MNGAEALIRTLVDHGVDTCFMNPGTSEMHFVAALDDVPAMHGVLALFEGVATGAADGYARMAARPAATLLHLGPGLGNGLANLHNARRARSPVVNIVGDHAVSPPAATTPSCSPTSRRWPATSPRRSSAPRSRPPASPPMRWTPWPPAAGPPGAVATLIVPADVSWSDGAPVVGAAGSPADRAVPPPGAAPDDEVVARAADALRSGEPDGDAHRRQGLHRGRTAGGGRHRRVHRVGVPVRDLPGPARARRRDRPGVDRLAYLAEFAAMQLEGIRHLVLVDAAPPVSFFAYPGRPSDLVPPVARSTVWPGPGDDVSAAVVGTGTLLEVAAGGGGARPEATRPGMPDRAADRPDGVPGPRGALLPEEAIVSDEGNTSGLFAPGATAGSPPHDWLCLTGGAIGQGLPVAVGAAVASPRPTGGGPRVRRQRALHPAVVVDHGP